MPIDTCKKENSTMQLSTPPLPPFPFYATITGVHSSWTANTHIIGQRVKVLSLLEHISTPELPSYELDLYDSGLERGLGQYVSCWITPDPDPISVSPPPSPRTVIPSLHFKDAIFCNLEDELIRAASDRKLRFRTGSAELRIYVRERLLRAWDAAVEEVLK